MTFDSLATTNEFLLAQPNNYINPAAAPHSAIPPSDNGIETAAAT